jgi:hypothetical protein
MPQHMATLPGFSIIYRPKRARIRPRKAFSSWMPVSVSSRFPEASKKINVVFPTACRFAKAWPSAVLRSARAKAISL